MFAAIKRRSLWIVVPVMLLLGPVIGMLYLNRGRVAVSYLLAVFASIFLSLLVSPGLSPTVTVVTFVVFYLGGLVHSIVIARRRDANEKLRWYARWPLFVVILLILGSSLAIRTYVLRAFSTPSRAMAPTLNSGDSVFANLLAYKYATPQRGDVIVYLKQDSGVYFLKRIVGLPGDKVQMTGGHLIINGVAAALVKVGPYTDRETGRPVGTIYTETLPSGRHYRVLDLMENSETDDTGVYEVPAGEYFVMGDSRDNSNDSRILQTGNVKANEIVGRVDQYTFRARSFMPNFGPLE